MTQPSQSQHALAFFQSLHTVLLEQLAHMDGRAWLRDPWQSKLGSGVTAVIEEGELFERGGCNFSHVRGVQLPAAATKARPELAGQGFEAAGVSLVLHPRNPFVPTVHMNVRFLQAGAAWWFGGGMDLTPYYGFEADCAHFHRTCQQALNAVDTSLYPTFKAACDRYFYLPHRQEARGIGGVFFDDFSELGFARCLDVVRAVGEAFLPAYAPIVARRRHLAYGERERAFQAWRRGRYVEFNLVYDRGTLFGLQSGGRTESILMSLPPLVRWRYDHQPKPGSEEARLLRDFLPPRDWAELVTDDETGMQAASNAA